MLPRALHVLSVALCLPASAIRAETWFVAASLASGANDGTSWADAFQGPLGLQTALAAARGGDEIWLAAGTYVPAAAGNRAASFEPAAGVALFGGFAGTELRLEQRDWTIHHSVLSGDLSGDDGPAFTNRDDNSDHVVRITADGVTLDGITIRGGKASDEPGGGGGLEIITVQDLVVRHCTLVDSEAQQGGAVFVDGAALFENCAIAGNRATTGPLSSGGGVHVAINQQAEFQPLFVNCLFSGNVAAIGGGILADHAFCTLTNCTIVGNESTASNFGAGAILEGTFGSLTITNCVLWGNNGTGPPGSDLVQLWTPNLASFLQLNQTCIQDYAGTLQTGGTGNFGDDPMFVDELGTDGRAASGDEDYRPSAGSPLIDRGMNAALPPNVASDLAGQPRRVDDPATPDQGVGSSPLIDVGAFEFQAAGPAVPALSPAGLAVCALVMGIAAIWIIARRGRRA
jgi:hypothetical protein